VSRADPGDSMDGIYEVGVAIAPLFSEPDKQNVSRLQAGPGQVPGFDETIGRPRLRSNEQETALIKKGEEAVRMATEAIADQVGLAAQRIAAGLGEQAIISPAPGTFGLDSVDVSFGVTLAMGIQALFTTQAESSVQVTMTFSRRAGSPGDGAP
jgi:hypothetical protein